MNAPIGFNELIVKTTATLGAVTTAPGKGVPVVDLLSYSVLGPYMFMNWQFEEDVIASAGNFTAVATTNIFTLSTHGFRTGIKVRVSNSGGALPTGLAAATDYYVIKIDANTFYLSASLNGALNGGAIIDITTDGTGTNTVTPQAVAGSAGSGTYLMTIPGSYEIDTNFISVGTTTHSNVVGTFAVKDSAGTAVDLAGYVVAYSATQLAFVANKAFIASNYLGINASDKPVKYSMQASFPIINRNYQW
jgi:hypothetical protein